MNTESGGRVAVFALNAVAALAMASAALALAPMAAAQSEDCDETLTVSDTYDLVEDTDVPVDFSTLIDVEGLVDDYTAKIDEALDAEYEDLDPPDGISSDDLIDEGRSEIEDAVDLGRSIAGCED
jgi:hypothetical protein